MLKVLLVNNGTTPENWQKLQAIVVAAGYDVTPIDFSAIGAIDPRGYDLAILSGGLWYFDQVELLENFAEELEFIRSTPIPILGICIGFQLMHVAMDQAVPLLDEEQHGFKEISVNIAGQILFDFPPTITVFKNHTVGVIETDPQFEQLATSPGHAEITLHKEKPLLGVQFHPEDAKTEDDAVRLLHTLVGALLKIPKVSDTQD